MAALLIATTTQAVRAVIGVAEESGELPDQYFTDRQMVQALRIELYEWLPESLEALQASADAATDPYADAVKVWDAVRQAATYWCAAEVVRSGAVSLFQRMDDGDNKVLRQAFDPKVLFEEFIGRYSYYQGVALRTYSPSSSSSVFRFVRSASPTYDPVANV